MAGTAIAAVVPLALPGAGAGAAGASAATKAAAHAAAVPAGKLPIGNVFTAVEAELSDAGGMPPGSDNWSCKPSAAHPYPVILVHGTFASEAISWQALSPMLFNAGYCVYAFDYGHTEPGIFYGMGAIAGDANVLSKFVAKVLASTGASQVDLVGHSLGGMMPRYYIDFLGGAKYVHMLVALSPSNHGTTLYGLNTLILLFQKLGLPTPSTFGCDSCNQQMTGSSFLAHLNKGGGTVASVKYVVIETSGDEVVVPYTSAFLTGSNVENITLQNQCSDDWSDHLSIIYDLNALSDVMNALGPDDPNFQPHCVPAYPIIGS
jgi:triacylglycerol esterase/lipase EstA (alpha/beta hydrolase family)